MTSEAGRPQDQGRSHHRKGKPSAETTSLLADWQATMRHELRAIVEAVGARASGLLPDVPASFVIPLDDARRDRLFDRGVKLGRELGTEVDVAPPVPEPTARRGPRRSRVDYG